MFGFGLFVYAAAGIMLAGNGGDLDDSVIFGLILAVVILLPFVFYYRLSKNMSYKQTATSGMIIIALPVSFYFIWQSDQSGMLVLFYPFSVLPAQILTTIFAQHKK